jgi:Protein of unknown function (DUF2752)
VISAQELGRSFGWTLVVLAPFAALALVLGFVYAPEALAQGAPWSSLGLVAPHCPGCWLCGMSRAFAALGHGHLGQAVQHNPLVLAVWPMSWLVALGGAFVLVRNLTARRPSWESRR